MNPSVCQSGNYEGATALKRHGRGAIRALFVQSAKKLLQVENPLRKWGLTLAARRGRNKAAVAVKLCVAVWHLLQGHPIGALERLDRLQTKLFKFATELGVAAIKAQGYASKEAFGAEVLLTQKLPVKRRRPGEPRFPKPLLLRGTERNLMRHQITNFRLYLMQADVFS